MSYVLVPTELGGGPPIPLLRPVILIGRHPECDVRINQPKISRRHCCVALAYERVLIRDLGSRNGLRVNGELVEESRLFVQDEVAIGPLIYRMVAESEKTDGPATSNARPSTTKAGHDMPPQPSRPVPPDRQRAHPDDSDDVGLVPLDSL